MTHKQVEKYILSLPDAKLDYPFGEDVAVYKVGDPSTHSTDAQGRPEETRRATSSGQGKMFALVREKKMPVQISLKCDPLLAETLRQKYDTVMPGYHLNKKHWNTILLTGQLSWPEIQDLIRHSYHLVANS